jgi:tetratricopeptide (TPR) repeat protein
MPGTSAFTADSRLLAVVLSAGSVHLFDVVSWEEVAQLSPLGPAYGGWMEFSASGALLAMASPTLQAVKLWDVAAIRRELRGFGLDWEESLPREERVQPILGLDVDPGEPRSRTLEVGRSRTLDLALVEIATRWLELDPDGETLARRAALHRRLGAREEALADLDALIALEQDRLARGGSAGWRERLLAALRSRADLLADMGRIEEAIEDHAAAIAADPQDVESRLHAARLLSAARG